MMMRINLDENKHVAFLLTRRICRFMLENLSVFLDLPVQSALPVSQAAPQIPRQFEGNKENLEPFAGLDLKTPFQERKAAESILSTGNDKELVANAACKREQDTVSFTFFIQDAESLNLNLPKKLALGIHQLLAEIATQAQWFTGLTQIAAVEASQASEEVQQTKTSVTYH